MLLVIIFFISTDACWREETKQDVGQQGEEYKESDDEMQLNQSWLYGRLSLRAKGKPKARVKRNNSMNELQLTYE